MSEDCLKRPFIYLYIGKWVPHWAGEYKYVFGINIGIRPYEAKPFHNCYATWLEIWREDGRWRKLGHMNIDHPQLKPNKFIER